ncbi:MAG: dihydroorotate dehydrogenase electron transfer subunit [Candidatus Magasanikbacteria bacterium]|nr:dihydroorotate dehydrogenase electron transfer subunit [Candidatus Magasanikbacteria bacterium]
MCALKTGDRVGISGPYGHPFTIKPNTHYITVGGGYGAGPLGTLAEAVAANHGTVDFCVGARNKDLLLFANRVRSVPRITTHIATDDGSAGYHGYVTDVLEQLIHENIKTLKHKNICVSTCGPELMEKKVLDICNRHNVDCEISIERYMKCGFNICGQCCADSIGIPLCTIGPVVSREVANQITEFGRYHRDKSGAKREF